MNVKLKEIIMSLMNFYFVYLIYCNIDVVDSTTITKLDRKSEEFRSKPIDLMDLMLKEHQRPEMLLEKQHEAYRKLHDSQFREEITGATKVNSEVDANVVARKVWSRWSKWGECSATCGGGAKTRRRLCLAGHCAPGEREEQRRPCCRQPCE